MQVASHHGRSFPLHSSRRSLCELGKFNFSCWNPQAYPFVVAAAWRRGWAKSLGLMPHIADFVSNPVAISICSGLFALVSLGFSYFSWRQAHRPLVSARVTTFAAGNSGIALNLLVENTGTQPARDIQLIARVKDVRTASSGSKIPKDAQRCFFSGICIPILANGRDIKTAFGHLGTGDSWRAGADIPVTLRYRDLSGRRFSSKVRLLLGDDVGFAQTLWGSGGRNGS